MTTAEEITLEWHKYVVRQPFSRLMLENTVFSIEEHGTFIFDQLVFQLSKDFLRHRIGSARKQYSVPATWWQHFKRDAFDRRGLRWLRRRLGVRYVTNSVSWEQGVDFPDVEYPRELGKPVKYLSMESHPYYETSEE